MTELNNPKYLFRRAVAKVIQSARLYRYFNLPDDDRPTSSFNLVYFCGKSGIEYLNASLYSVYRNWNSIPNIIIVSDGTPLDYLKQNLIKWPRTVNIISWEDAGLYYKNKGELELYNIALTKIWPGKKLISILYLAEKGEILYCDSDVLWYSSPRNLLEKDEPFIKMGKDIVSSYSSYVLNELHKENFLARTPLNAGVMHIHGDFISYPEWEKLWQVWLSNPDIKDFFCEQTAFVLLNDHFNKNTFWNENDILIKLDDANSVNYTFKKFPQIMARHYVSEKKVLFWRDFFYMCISKK